MVNVSLPPDFNRDTHVESIQRRVASDYWRSWLEFVVNNFQRYVKEAISKAQELKILDASRTINIRLTSILRRIYNHPQVPSLAAYDIYNKRYLISFKNFYHWISSVYRQQPRYYARLASQELRHLAHHETGHMILDQYYQVLALDPATAAFHEAFAEYIAWLMAYASGDSNYISYVQNSYISQAKLLFDINPRSPWKHPEEQSMSRLLNLYLGDPRGQLEQHRSHYRLLRSGVKDLYRALYEYRFSGSKDPSRLLAIKKKLQALLKQLELLEFYQEELGFLMLEGKKKIVNSLVREIYQLSKLTREVESRKKLGFIDMVKIAYRATKFLLTYRRFIRELEKTTAHYRTSRLSIDSLAWLIYRRMMLWPYGYKYIVNLPERQMVIIRLPDLGHTLGFRLAYRWLQQGEHPKKLLSRISRDPGYAWRLGYAEFRDWINFIYKKYYVKPLR